MDREKVIRGLECCFNPHSEHSCLCRCADCPYNPSEEDDWSQQCQIELNKDALALLKEQEHKDRMFHALEDDWKRIKELLKEQEVKTGKWIEKTDYMGDTYYDCSVCNESWITIEGTPWVNGMNYCPHCGAKMAFEGR